MDATFNADEIFEIAEEIERNGAAFYRRAADSIEDTKARHLLLTLAAMEDDHVKTFAAMRAELTEEAWDVDLDLDDQAGMYLRAIADGHVFDTKTEPAQLLTGEESFEEILRIAIGLEKDSLVFYHGMRDMVPEQFGKDKLDRIISEEKRHITELSQELEALGEQA